MMRRFDNLLVTVVNGECRGLALLLQQSGLL